MGLFDSLKSKKEPTFDPQKSVMTIVVASIMADGDASDEEIGRMRSMCARSPIFSKNTKDEDDAVIDFAINVVKQLGDDGIAKAANALKPELKETAFAFASEIILADGIVGDDEEQFLTQLAKTLGIDDSLARSIIEVTLIRGRGP